MNNNRGNNNNNNNNNRRRGRTNNRPQGGGGGGGQQINRIDSRARGNAPQMLEKYRKLAQDAHLNGDRVSAEYYLQFADHYFRVSADTRIRLEESRLRRDPSWQDNGEGYREDGDDSGGFDVESDFPAFDQPPVYTRRDREDRPVQNERPAQADRPVQNERPVQTERPVRADRAVRDDRPAREDRPRDSRPRDDRPRDERPARFDRVAREERPAREAAAVAPVPAEPAGDEPRSIYEPPANPFVRDNRGLRGPRIRREGGDDRRPRRDQNEQATAAVDEPTTADPAFDPASLPPAIAAGGRRTAKAAVVEETVTQEPVNETADAKPRRRAPRRKPSGGSDETLESVA